MDSGGQALTQEDYSDAQEQQTTGLTPLGHRMALGFGEQLPSGRSVGVFNSYYARCVQTACDIADGYRTIGGSAELVSDIPMFVGPLGDPTEFAEQWI